ncbi:hypothetical protein C4585_01525 [Candidatus Parcubacteria bacterium]|nr:MAG: hypothetical protein C4585_01525 [Candidatus Parcubacteria bacterium]
MVSEVLKQWNVKYQAIEDQALDTLKLIRVATHHIPSMQSIDELTSTLEEFADVANQWETTRNRVEDFSTFLVCDKVLIEFDKAIASMAFRLDILQSTQ